MRPAAAFEMADELVGKVVNIDHDAPDPRPLQAIEHMVDQRPAVQAYEGLGKAFGQRAHAQSESRR
jgi:hypothetical protein